MITMVENELSTFFSGMIFERQRLISQKRGSDVKVILLVRVKKMGQRRLFTQIDFRLKSKMQESTWLSWRREESLTFTLIPEAPGMELADIILRNENLKMLIVVHE